MRPPPLALDHLVVCARALGEGAAWVEAALGAATVPGGAHPAMGTRNRLLSLGPGAYLEVIAVDPDAPPPGRARWFGLDGWDGPPALAAWVARTDDLDAALAAAPEGAGEPLDLERGDLRWRMGVPRSGEAPLGAAHPYLIEWRSEGAAGRLPDAGCRLLRLEIATPAAPALREALAGLLAADERIRVGPGPPGFGAVIATPSGPRRLGAAPA